MMRRIAIVLALFACTGIAVSAEAPPYGAAVTLEQAKRIAAAALAEAGRRQWRVAVAIVDTHGFLKYYEMLDDTQTASAAIAVEKARTAAMFRRPSKAFEDGIAGGRAAILGLPGVTPIDGGLPIVIDGRIVGAIGVSGVNSNQDAEVAQAGLNALK
jgi:glc operon protein GlcG